MSSAKARWGVIGSGGIAMRRTIPEGIMQAANAQLVAIYDVNQQANRDLAAKLGVKACAFEDELLGEEIDAVYIATPAYLHHDQVIRAADAGKHILCEKPLGLTVAQAQAMLNACRQASVELGAAFMMRFQSQHQAALKMIQEGRLGQMVFARAQLSCWYPPIQGAWRQDPKLGGGGSLIDMGGHCIDLLEMFLGKAVSVQCSSASAPCITWRAAMKSSTSPTWSRNASMSFCPTRTPSDGSEAGSSGRGKAGTSRRWR
ncbi:MAG: Gfo/Idh/MocA family oxidoreductase [Planctomycetes bacterium]|nr:Gfo/Idh/MocA family oxidoreductase [Planctomycetota bacterium]